MRGDRLALAERPEVRGEAPFLAVLFFFKVRGALPRRCFANLFASLRSLIFRGKSSKSAVKRSSAMISGEPDVQNRARLFARNLGGLDGVKNPFHAHAVPRPDDAKCVAPGGVSLPGQFVKLSD